MYKITPNDMAEVENLIKGAEAVEKWLLADIEKYKQD
jgi:glycine cleavage system H protein